MLGIDDIIKNITVHTGASRGIGGQELRAIWHAIWVCVERLVAQGKSVTVPNFATIFVVAGPSGSSLSFQLHPYFTSTHCISSPSDVKSPASGAAPAVPLHASFVEQELQGAVPRHAIVNAIKDTARHIGLTAGTGKAVRLDCNPVMTLNFLNCRCNVAFNGRLARVLPSPSRSVASSKAAAAGGGAGGAAREEVSAARSDTSQTGGQQQQQMMPRPPSSSTGNQQQQQHQQMPPIGGYKNTPPSTPAKSDRSGSRASSARGAGGDSSRNVNPMSLAAAGGAGAGNSNAEAISAARGTFSAGSSLARAQNREQRMKICRDVVDHMPGLSVPKKHALKKTMYKKMRGDVYRNIWEQNEADVSARRAQEAATDKQLMEHLDAVAAHEKAMLEQRDRDRRRKAMEDRLLNQKLAPLQKQQQLPRAQDPGEIFYMRSDPMVLQKDTATLQRQIDDRKMRQERQREQDKEVGDRAHEEYLRVKQEAAEEKARRAARQEQLRAETERIIQEKNVRRQQELEHDRHMARTGGLFFEEGGNVFAERSRAIMRENVALMRQRALDSQKTKEDAMRNQGIAFQNQLVEDAATAVAHRKHENDVKSQMRESWNKQISDKKARQAAEKRARDQWRDKWNIQNSSSDEEDG